MSLPLSQKYAPKNSASLIGREVLVAKIKQFITDYKKSKKKAILLHGPSGVGKTSLIHAIANELQHELFELNASDQRNQSSLDTVLLPALTMRSFFSANKIILLDEVDGLSGTEDRGGASAIKAMLEQAKFPVILTANDGYHDKLKPLRTVCEVIAVEPLQPKDVQIVLENVAKQENIAVEPSALQAIARKNISDIRGSLNDLDLLASTHKSITSANVIELDERLKDKNMADALTLIFKASSAKEAARAFDDVDEDMDGWLLWMDYNMPKEYTNPMDRARAYGMISRADVFRGRIRKRQDWRFLVYINDLLTSGIAAAKDVPYKTAPAYKESSRLLKAWITNNQISKKKSIAEKIAEKTHTSKRRVLQSFALYKTYLKKKDVQSYFGFDDDEKEFLAKL